MTTPETLIIDHIGGKGDGVALRNDEPVFVPFTTTGDVVSASITETKDAFHGQIETLISSGPDRVAPPCPHFGICGGCQLQHISTEAYRKWKESSVHLQFEKSGLLPLEWLPPVFIGPHTRRRVTFAALKKGKDVILAFNAARSNELVDLKVCLLLTPALEALRDKLKPYLNSLLPEGKVSDVSLQDIDGAIELILTGDFGDLPFQKMGVISEMGHTLGLARIGWRPKPFAAAEPLLELAPTKKTFGKIQVDIPPGTFLQPSREGEDALVAAVLAGCKGLKNKKIADLFSGCGTFSGHLIAHGSVYAAESDLPAISALKKVAASIPQKLSVEKRDLAKEPMTPTELRAIDCVVFDPPRSGAKEQAEQLAKSKTPRVIGVSCNPSTFIRDAGILVKGGYTFKSLQLVDQFVWSAHSEVVGVFVK